VTVDVFTRLAQCTGFDWDGGNAPKLQARQRVTTGECEQVFFQEPLVIAPDTPQSLTEERWAAWGRTAEGRTLAVAFTLRQDRIRPISARDMNRKERQRYAQAQAAPHADS
jgi:uncharacterized protein